MALKKAIEVEGGRFIANYHRIERVRPSKTSVNITLVSYMDAEDRATDRPPIGAPITVNVALVEKVPPVKELIRYDTIDGEEVPVYAEVEQPDIVLEAALEPAKTLYERYYQLVKTDPGWQDAEDLL